MPRRDIQRDTPLFGRNGYVPLAELQDRIIVSWMKTGYTKEARLILQSEIYIFCYTTKLESKKQTVRQTTKKTNQQTNRKLWNHRWNRHKYCKVQYYDTIFSFTPSPHLGMCYWKFNDRGESANPRRHFGRKPAVG